MILGVNEKEFNIITNILHNYPDYEFFCYGSRVKGTFEKTSDLDVLVKGKQAMPLNILQELKEKFDESSIPYIVNFSDFYSINANFYQLIEKDLIKL